MSHLESKSPKALASQGEKDADPGIAEIEDAKKILDKTRKPKEK